MNGFYYPAIGYQGLGIPPVDIIWLIQHNYKSSEASDDTNSDTNTKSDDFSDGVRINRRKLDDS